MGSCNEVQRRFRQIRYRFHDPVLLGKMAGTNCRRDHPARPAGTALHAAVSLFAVLFFLAASWAQAGSQTIILKYRDFGPPSLAWETIRMDWWQWDNHGDSDPRSRCNIYVVVYRGIPLDKVKGMYPVRKKINQDFRYLEYSKALEYLDKTIKELSERKNDEVGTFEDLAQELRNTRKKIVDALGGP